MELICERRVFDSIELKHTVFSGPWNNFSQI